MPDRVGFSEAGSQVDTLSCHQVSVTAVGGGYLAYKGGVGSVGRWVIGGSPFESCGLQGWGFIFGLQQCLGG